MSLSTVRQRTFTVRDMTSPTNHTENVCQHCGLEVAYTRRPADVSYATFVHTATNTVACPSAEILTPGTRVRITPNDDLLDTAWWPKSGDVTGTVERVFKNGKVAVAVDQLGNRSDDHKRTIHFGPADLTPVRGR